MKSEMWSSHFFFRNKICNCLNRDFNCNEHISILFVFLQFKLTLFHVSFLSPVKMNSINCLADLLSNDLARILLSSMLFLVHGRLPFDQIFWVISGNFHRQMAQSFSNVEDDNCSLGIFRWLLGLNHKYRSKQNTDKSTSWLFIDHNSSENVAKQAV